MSIDNFYVPNSLESPQMSMLIPPPQQIQKAQNNIVPLNQKIIFKQQNSTSIKREDESIKMSYVKRFYELFAHLDSLRKKGVVNQKEIGEILLQFTILEVYRSKLVKHRGEVVVVCNGELFFGKTLNESIKKAREKHGRKPLYSESIDMVDYPSIYDNSRESVLQK
jgi:hypothetical protein